jgi:hypothetical protein
MEEKIFFWRVNFALSPRSPGFSTQINARNQNARRLQKSPAEILAHVGRG